MQFPGPLRAVVGLLANAADEAKHLPDRAVELPMLAVSTALQVSLRAQQRYARLAARGEEVLNRRPPTDEPPSWATFDEPVSIDEVRRGTLSAEQAQVASDLLDELLADDGASPAQAPEQATAPAKKAPAAKEAPKAPARQPPPVKPATAKKAPTKRAADGERGKSVSKPRHVAPSRFDVVDDD